MVSLYRRYRPQDFSGLIGQSHVTSPLSQALVAGSTHHAYLFSGPRGCGKTTSARILARCLNCASGPTANPCGSCESCVDLARDGNGSLDVVEIDAASHNGVDDARELRERAIFAPARDRFKIFILDEAHMVTQQGFNALLKIVEEPPEHVKFIFATTEPEKVLPTIRSRTHHYPFRLVPSGELLDYLMSVANQEGIDVEKSALSLVVRAGGGSVRDSLSVLDQLISGSGGHEITEAAARELLGFTPRDLIEDLVDSIAVPDPQAAFSILNRGLSAGHDPRQLGEDLLHNLRDLLVFDATGGGVDGLFPGAVADDLGRWKTRAERFAPGRLAEMASLVAESLEKMTGVTSHSLQMELLIARLLDLQIQEKTPKQTGLEGGSGAVGDSVAAPDEAPQRQAHDVGDQDEAVTSSGYDSEAPEALTVEILLTRWADILAEIEPLKRSLWLALVSSRPVTLDADVLTLGFARLSDSEVLKKPQGPGNPLANAELLREVLARHFGIRLRFRVEQLPTEVELEPANSARDSAWPVVTQAATSEPAGGVGEEPEAQTAEDPVQESQTRVGEAQLASRGEPIVRQLLGGELVGEEVLDSMSHRGESDV